MQRSSLPAPTLNEPREVVRRGQVERHRPDVDSAGHAPQGRGARRVDDGPAGVRGERYVAQPGIGQVDVAVAGRDDELQVRDVARRQDELPRVAAAIEEVQGPAGGVDRERGRRRVDRGPQHGRARGVERPAVAGRGRDVEDAAAAPDRDGRRPVERAALRRDVGDVATGAAMPGVPRSDRERGAHHESGDQRGSQQRRQRETRPASKQAHPDRDDRERPEPDQVGERGRVDRGQVRDDEDAADRHQHDAPVEKSAIHPHWVSVPHGFRARSLLQFERVVRAKSHPREAVAARPASHRATWRRG